MVVRLVRPAMLCMMAYFCLQAMRNDLVEHRSEKEHIKKYLVWEDEMRRIRYRYLDLMRRSEFE